MDSDMLKFKPYIKDLKIEHILKRIDVTEEELRSVQSRMAIYEIILGIIVAGAGYATGLMSILGGVGGIIFFMHMMKKSLKNFVPAFTGLVKFAFIPIFPPLALIPIGYLSLKFFPDEIHEKFMHDEEVTALNAKKALKWHAICKAFNITITKKKTMMEDPNELFKKGLNDHEKLEKLDLPIGIWEKIVAKFSRSARKEAKEMMKEIKDKVDKQIKELEDKVKDSVFKTLRSMERSFRRALASGLRMLGTAMSALGKPLCIPVVMLVILVIIIIVIAVYYFYADTFSYSIFYLLFCVVVGPILIAVGTVLRVIGGALAAVFSKIVFEVISTLVRLTMMYASKMGEVAGQAYAEAKSKSDMARDVKQNIDQEITYYYKTYSAECKDTCKQEYERRLKELANTGYLDQPTFQGLLRKKDESKPEKVMENLTQLTQMALQIQSAQKPAA